jgi:ATP-dependent DNA helicase RecQ
MAKRKADDVVVPGVDEPPDRTRQARTVEDDATPATDGGAVVDALSALRRYFPRHQGFKPGQERVITALLSGENNAAAIFPTGGGKSLCYLLPGLALHEANAGMTLVISPLLALMKDQVDAARQLNHPADMLASSLSLEEKIEVARRVQDGETAVLYMAPEQLNNERSLALIRQVKIAMIAIDEAHCISEWGNSFRPDYLRLAKLCADWKVPRVVALTATATPRVANDICQAFRVDGQNCVRTSFFRSNLKFQFVAVEQSNRDAVLIRSIQRLAPGDIIVYCTLQKTTQEVADRLNRIPGFEARPYHAGLDTETRKGTQDWYMTKSSTSAAATKYRVVVATIAFGRCLSRRTRSQA